MNSPGHPALEASLSASPAAARTLVLEVRDLRKAYRTPEGETKTVVAVSRFTLAARAQLGLRGQSGSGKTTFLNLIAGIVKSDGGSIRLNGVELAGMAE